MSVFARLLEDPPENLIGCVSSSLNAVLLHEARQKARGDMRKHALAWRTLRRSSTATGRTAAAVLLHEAICCREVSR